MALRFEAACGCRTGRVRKNNEDNFVFDGQCREELRPGDQFLLCSDGLTDMLSDEELALLLQEPGTAEESVQKLLEAALDRGGRDNVTAILCRIV